VICEAHLRTTIDVRRAFDAGAFAVVVGGAITGIDGLVRQFVRATPHQ
jgi:N-acylglucosamine-6-phosphate 2-epimerase